VYDALGRRVEQTNSSGTREILYGPNGSKLALMSGQTSVEAFIPLAGGATAVYSNGTLGWYRHPDWLGSSRIGSYPTKQQNPYYDGEASYSPFGESPAETGNIDHNFTGQNQDLTSILYDFQAREYNPGEGRWISPDPAGLPAVNPMDPQTWNRYVYVRNNPLALVDPTGRFVCAYPLGNVPDDGPGENEQECEAGGGTWNAEAGDPGYLNWSVITTLNTGQLPAFGQGVVDQLEDESDALSTGTNVLAGTGAAFVAAPYVVLSAGPAAVSGLAKLAGSYYATMPGATAAVLGAYRSVYNPSYLNAAQGWANALDIPLRVYSFLDAFGEGWTANQQFLNNVVAAGQQVYLSEGPLGNAGLYEGLASELAYLESIGVGPNQWWMLVH
jgi:RHS repeat-associated protein